MMFGPWGEGDGDGGGGGSEPGKEVKGLLALWSGKVAWRRSFSQASWDQDICLA